MSIVVPAGHSRVRHRAEGLGQRKLAGRRGTGLASTGFAGTSIAIVAGIIVVAGVAFLVVARIRRKRA